MVSTHELRNKIDVPKVTYCKFSTRKYDTAHTSVTVNVLVSCVFSSLWISHSGATGQRQKTGGFTSVSRYLCWTQGKYTQTHMRLIRIRVTTGSNPSLSVSRSQTDSRWRTRRSRAASERPEGVCGNVSHTDHCPLSLHSDPLLCDLWPAALRPLTSKRTDPGSAETPYELVLF